MSDQQRLLQLQQWYQTEQSSSLYRAEAVQISRMLSSCYGYQLLQIGGPSEASWLQASPIRHKIWLTPNLQKKYTADITPLCSSARALPFAPNSLDVVILPHILECLDEPMEILQEATQVLAPNGYLIITGINRLSLWGCHIQWQRWRHQAAVLPWLYRLYPLHYLHKCLLQASFSLDETSISHFLPLASVQEETPKWQFLKWLGPICWPALGASYVILARKQVAGLTPLFPQKFNLSVAQPKIGLASQNSNTHD